MKYDKIKKKKDYDTLLNSGLFFEFFPELSGNYNEDLVHIKPSCKTCYDFGYVILSDGKNTCPNCMG